MSCIGYKTTYAKKQAIEKKWLVVDAANQPLGRLSSRIAYIIRGKHKPVFTPHVDTGDHVIVLNAAKVALSGKKELQKVYVRYTGYPGGVKKKIPQEVRASHPIRMIEHAVKGMLPKNRLGRRLFHNLHVCPGEEHNHLAQKPVQITLKY